MKPNGIPPALLERYLSGECTDEEKELVETWYASLQGETRYLDHLPDAEQDEMRQATFGNIRRELNMVEEAPVRSFPWRWLSGIAASIALVLGVYLATQFKKTPVASIPQQLEQRQSSELVRFENTGSRIVTHRLPDSSSIAMHPHAVVTYPAGFDADRRLVTFSGEGFFDIQKDKKRPFYIQSGDMVIKVLGTSFNIRAPQNRKVFQVDVVTGTVEVRTYAETKESQQVILKPNQQALFELDSKRLTSKTSPLQAKKEIYEPVTIVFEETPLNKVIEQLEKRFNVSISLANPGLAKCGLTANFESQTFPGILELLCSSLDVTYTISDNNITINGEPCE
ncbi:MAG: iron dicitrate transport regulator FecR [Dyadobacter sp. 50-39]|uniref:FecR family protein n=1 Tax=Dyadobacter sp. 50-39 TaxID=1895756 RepID=UPI000961ECC6|nr:FecR domain-containing protein [Dyadobacter sp. 50-39]OJV19971.1 MAG: iron dicitrate transport regulator FecR [Dyadobacter sp. 50-39]